METNFILHPTVSIQIGEHKSRSAFMEPSFLETYKYIIGIIYGKVDENKVEMVSTTETIIKDSKLVEDTYENIKEYHKINFPGEQEIGWYHVSPLSDSEIQTINAIFEEKFHVYVIATYNADSEPLIELRKPEGDGTLKKVLYVYKSDKAEHITIMNIQCQGDVSKQVSFTSYAYQAMEKQLATVKEFLEKTRDGKIPYNRELVRKCNDICIWFNHAKTEQKDLEILEEANILLLSGLLAEALPYEDL